MYLLTYALLLAGATASAILPRRGVALNARATDSYAPVPAACPSTPLVRAANGINSREQAYVNTRKPIATKAFQAYLAKTGLDFPTLAADQYPALALTTSGGGLRSLLIGAGVHKAFDLRDGGDFSTAGLYQSLTYEAGLSGGGWLLSSLAADNYPTVSSIQADLWTIAFAESLVVAANDDVIAADVEAKSDAGFPVSLVDAYGREVGYSILYGTKGGVRKRFSDIAGLSSFTAHHVPFPIITATGVDTALGQCAPPANATQYEISPYEFGSFDAGVAAFTQTQYLGSSLSNGQPTVPGHCVEGFDNTAFIFGTSSDIFPGADCPVLSSIDQELLGIPELEELLPPSLNSTLTNPDIVYAQYPNPFRNYAPSTLVSTAPFLTLADGGLSNQNNPIWPFLHRPAVSVLFVNDNSADTSANYPNGSEIYNTYIQAQLQGLAGRMPAIPDAATFVAQGLNVRPTFFGCNSAATTELAIAYLPNVGYGGYDSGKSTYKIEYLPYDTQAMITTGALMASYNNTMHFAGCLGCLAMKKAVAAAGKALPGGCTECFATFCYN